MQVKTLLWAFKKTIGQCLLKNGIRTWEAAALPVQSFLWYSLVQQHVCTSIYRTFAFVMARHWEQPTWSSERDFSHKLEYIPRRHGHFRQLLENEADSHICTKNHLKNIVVNKKARCRIVYLVGYHLRKCYVHWLRVVLMLGEKAVNKVLLGSQEFIVWWMEVDNTWENMVMEIGDKTWVPRLSWILLSHVKLPIGRPLNL